MTSTVKCVKRAAQDMKGGTESDAWMWRLKTKNRVSFKTTAFARQTVSSRVTWVICRVWVWVSEWAELNLSLSIYKRVIVFYIRDKNHVIYWPSRSASESSPHTHTQRSLVSTVNKYSILRIAIVWSQKVLRSDLPVKINFVAYSVINVGDKI